MLRRWASGVALFPGAQRLSAKLTANDLRVLAFHGVEDLEYFGAVIEHVTRKYRPVDGDDVAEAIVLGRPLPPRSVWFTFDDGLQSTFEAGEVLAAYGVRATLFVNPETLAEPVLHWFSVRDLAEQHGLIGSDEQENFSMRRLKRILDKDRRVAVAELRKRIETTRSIPRTLSGTVEDMRRWLEAGHEIGNHTWDHPCLDHCTANEQRSQIERAHFWLLEHGVKPRFFAYPNGDWVPQTERVLTELGYLGALLFDHRLSHSGNDSFRISRLRIDASAPLARVDAIMSGVHSLLFGMVRGAGPAYAETLSRDVAP